MGMVTVNRHGHSPWREGALHQGRGLSLKLMPESPVTGLEAAPGLFGEVFQSVLLTALTVIPKPYRLNILHAYSHTPW